MLATFALRLAFGLALCLLLLSPDQVNPRYFRTHFLTAFGLAIVAAILLRDSASALLLVLLASAAGVSFLGSFLWSLENAPGGRACIGICVVVLFACLAVMPSTLPWSWNLADDLTSALLLGSALSAMLMGHMYLIAPSMTIAPLIRLLTVFFLALSSRLLLAALGLYAWSQHHRLTNLEDVTVLWLPLRWGLGFIAPFVMGYMAWQTAKIKSTQSATGILYVVVIFCFLGELTSQLLRGNSGFVL